MDRQLAARNAMVDWQVAPPDYEIANYDEPKFKYRKYVKDMIHSLPKKSAKKKTFITISTNVLCAEISSKNPSIDPIDRDIYQPLEIALVKWTTADTGKERGERKVDTKAWIIDPGSPFSNIAAMDHKHKHKIDYAKFTSNDSYVDRDLEKIVKEINAFLTPDRTVFSNSIRHCRQDIGCLKWLNRQTGYHMKPIKVLSAEDLYVVLLRHLSFGGDQENEYICQGVARLRFGESSNLYDVEGQCDYHRALINEDEGEECGNCAKAIAEAWCHVILDDLFLVMQEPEADSPAKTKGDDSTVESKKEDDATGDISARLSAVNLGDRLLDGH